MPGACTSVTLTPPQEQDKGDDTTPTVSTNGTITTKITRVIDAQVVATTVRCALHPKVTSRPWAVGWTTEGHHSVHGGWTGKNHCNTRTRKGVIGGGTPDKGRD
jgi:hypothetical protein